ncbi:hypothetical protein [Vibrio sonorensis]|uniref:hypothetical protein n=1 Tax=Vibrio sonorensis TaxID=1004316 RepID=UPI0008D8F089|nr:hypothetical protein [Vibrio sonorensis]
MQQGMLSSVLLACSLLFFTSSAVAKEMQSEEVVQWKQDDQVQLKVAELLQLFVEQDIDQLQFSLQRLAFPQQEVARYLLLDKVEQHDLILSPQMARFVESQRTMHPTYQMTERGDGYEFTVPAFNYPATASRLLKKWTQDQSTLDFILKAEEGNLDLQEWLSGQEAQVQAREKLMIRELDSLSPEAVTKLTEQFIHSPVVSWLPSTQVMVRLAQVSESDKIYNLLWLMKADFFTQEELNRLAKQGDDFAQRQLIAATKNPSLKNDAIVNLVRIHPMSNRVKTYLISRMSNNDDASFVAKALVQQGYSGWLSELASNNQSVNLTAIQQAMKP